MAIRATHVSSRLFDVLYLALYDDEFAEKDLEQKDWTCARGEDRV